MQVILPVAGLGTRLRPQTWSRPKPLVSVAGKTLIDHVIDRLQVMDLEKVVFITGYLGDQIEEHVRAKYDFESVFVEQEEQLGQSHAIIQARDVVSGPVIVLFPDMIFEADFKQVEQSTRDGAIYVRTVEDPSRFGVCVLEDGFITRLVEKPTEPVSDLAVMGIYYFSDAATLMNAIDRQLADEPRTQGEYFIADAIQIMIDDGAKFETFEADVWQDAGTNDALLDTNRYLLDRLDSRSADLETVIVPPVLIDPSATITSSVIGPYASIGANAEITGSIIRDSIIDEGARVEGVNITHSIVGRNAYLIGKLARANIGDNSDVELSWGEDRLNG